MRLPRASARTRERRRDALDRPRLFALAAPPERRHGDDLCKRVEDGPFTRGAVSWARDRLIDGDSGIVSLLTGPRGDAARARRLHKQQLAGHPQSKAARDNSCHGRHALAPAEITQLTHGDPRVPIGRQMCWRPPDRPPQQESSCLMLSTSGLASLFVSAQGVLAASASTALDCSRVNSAS